MTAIVIAWVCTSLPLMVSVLARQGVNSHKVSPFTWVQYPMVILILLVYGPFAYPAFCKGGET